MVSLSTLLRSEQYNGLPINRLVHFAPAADAVESASASSLLHLGAIKRLFADTGELPKGDFLVLDVVLTPTAISAMSKALLASTIWFDAANGAAFVAHHNEGLAHECFKRLAMVCMLDCLRPMRTNIYFLFYVHRCVASNEAESWYYVSSVKYYVANIMMALLALYV